MRILKEERKLYITRCELFLKRLLPDRLIETLPLHAVYANTGEPCLFAHRDTYPYQPIHEGETWGKSWESAWFHVTGEIPPEWQEEELAILVDFSGETLLVDNDGNPFYALTGHSVFNTSYQKDLYFPPKDVVQSGKIDFWIEAAASSLFGVNLNTDPDTRDPDIGGEFPCRMNRLRVGRFAKEAWALRFDFEILFGIYTTLDAESYRARQLLTTLNKAIDVYGDSLDNASQARAVLAKEMNYPAVASAMDVYAVGHAHIDVAWLWTVAESRRKVARTFASQLDLIERYPGYIFGASQPQLYAFLEEDYPQLFKRIQDAVRQGRWELQGAMWVEADCNIIGGEAMIRQFVHGKHYFREKFGVEVKSLWLPDVFGYSPALPQIIKKARCDYFLTQKLSWNQVNEIPYNTFHWRGLDGSSVLTHFPPENTYNASACPEEMIPAQDRFKEADIVPMFASLFGLGDGGGGPSENHIERALRMKNIEGCPRVSFRKSEDFFEDLSAYADRLPTWDGELYLEMHRGTFTAQARTKKNNRHLEQLLQTAEFICASRPLADYPVEQLKSLWRVLLLNQFHDIIPGSSIQPVYEVAEKEHHQAITACQSLIDETLRLLAVPAQHEVVAVNTLPCDYHGYINLPNKAGYTLMFDGMPLPSQDQGDDLIAEVTLPASNFTMLTLQPRHEKQFPTTTQETVLENGLIRYTFNERGELVSAFDKEAKRELVPQGSLGNLFTLYVDRPNDYEAWDIDAFYRDGVNEMIPQITSSTTTIGEAYSQLEIAAQFGDSTLTQQIRLSQTSRRLDFSTQVDWHEKRKMLRVSFPLALMSDTARCDIQCGHLERSLKSPNTSWERAKFEVPIHRYVDISEDNYGVALLNDCKYGHHLERGLIDLCLLRSALYPDLRADHGEHTFTYSLFPHATPFCEGETIREAYSLNRTPTTLVDHILPTDFHVPIRVKNGAIVMDTLKRAEASNDLVLRLIETRGRPTAVELEGPALVNAHVEETDLLEWDAIATLTPQEGTLNLTLQPFEIKTLKVIPKRSV